MRVPVIGVCCLVGACAHYDPQPLSVPVIAAEQQTLELDPGAVREELAAFAPSAAWDGSTWNELALFAAALENRPELRAARAAAATAAQNARVARVRPGPSFALLTEYAFHPNESSNWQVGVSADQLIDRGGRREARIGSADVAARAAEFAFRDAVWSARTDVAVALADLSAAIRTVELERQIGELRTRQLAAARHRVREGLTPGLEQEQARAAAAADEAATQAAEAAQVAARLALAHAVGVAPRTVGALTVTATPVSPPTADLTELRSDALEGRLDIFAAMAAYDQAEEALKSAVAAQYPEVRIGPGYAWERGLSKLPFLLTLTFPSADFGQAGIAAAEAGRREAAQRLELAVANAAYDIDRAHAEYETAREALALARNQALPAAAAIAEQATRALDSGAIDRTSWVDAQIAALTARIDLVGAELVCRRAQLTLERAVRRPLNDPTLRAAIDTASKPGEAP